MKIRKTKKQGPRKWQVDLGKIDGQRQRKYFETKAQAKTFLEAQKKELTNLGHSALGISHEDRLIVMASKKRLAPYNATIPQAIDFFLQHATKSVPMSLEQGITLCVEEKERAGKRPRYTQALRNSLERFALGRETKLCSEITTADIEDYLDNDELSPATRKSYLTDVATFFSFGLKRGWNPFQPCKGIEPILLEREAPCIFTPDQVRALLKAAKANEPTLIPMLALDLFAGIRPAETLKLTWQNINLETGYIEIPSKVSKTRRRRLVTISPNCKEWLKLGGEVPPINWRRRLTRVKENSGIKWGHDIMRHTFASYHISQHQSADRTALEAGNSPKVLLEHYRELVQEKDANAFWEITPASVEKWEPKPETAGQQATNAGSILSSQGQPSMQA